ncbi:D-lactate dehydrogenase [Sphingobium lactosutens]|uniref:D-lactate dehydrogenase n=1 Tax=Sphingobium lactosutens TaxID=522773 RepID=UPI0015BB3091|nr:D-lactate dehydrogenase [Sphingobium lactosutens]
MLDRRSTFGRPDSSPAGELIGELRSIVGRRAVLTGAGAARRFTTGFRGTHCDVLAVIIPGSLVQLWRSVRACVAARRIVIMQAANTSLTGGATPTGAYDREVILINMMRLKGVRLMRGGAQAIALPGTTLYELESALDKVGREPHSVIGSSCLGASVIGGICNNSGGALVQRGPAYTELSLYGQVGADGVLRLVNHLGVALPDDPEAALSMVEAGDIRDSMTEGMDAAASDRDYAHQVRLVDAPTPARFNANPERLFEASGSAGKMVVFAVRVDSFAKPKRTSVFYIGTNATSELTRIRRHILSSFTTLPIAGEYLHREAFDLAARYGKDTFLAIKYLGTKRLPHLFALKAMVDRIARCLPFVSSRAADHLLQAVGRAFPEHLPRRIRHFRDRFEHHLLLKVGDEAIEETSEYLQRAFPDGKADYFECTSEEAEAAFLHRFAVAGAAVRLHALDANAIEDVVALDIALRRNDHDWFEQLPEAVTASLSHKLYYGHFFCHVFHQDYVIRKGHPAAPVKEALLALLEQRGAEYPAEHNVGHIYEAKAALKAHYRNLDPCNHFNPGIGQTERALNVHH